MSTFMRSERLKSEAAQLNLQFTAFNMPWLSASRLGLNFKGGKHFKVFIQSTYIGISI